MTLIEFMGCFGMVLGAVIGGMLGYSLFGWGWAITGVPIGAIAGFVAGSALVAIPFWAGFAKERIKQRHRLQRHFGRYWARSRAKEWEALVERLTPGQHASGKVVSLFYYGVFVDMDHGFPALLKIGNSKGGIHTTQAAVGTCVSARILRCDDGDRFIELTQRDDALTEETVWQSAGNDAEDRTPQP